MLRIDLGEPQFDSDTVNVRASEDTLKQVSYVKALIDVKNVNGDFEVDAPLAAYNEKGGETGCGYHSGRHAYESYGYSTEKDSADPNCCGRFDGGWISY